MYLHKGDRELFREAVLLTSQKLGISEDIVEKDYYVTLILKKLSAIEYPVVFKGGTSLSKAFRVMDRFSEDIDITFTERLGEAKRKKLKYNILKPIADELGLMIRNFSLTKSGRNLNHYDFYYDSIIENKSINAIPSYVKLEISLMSYAFPTEEKELGNYILDAIGADEKEFISSYGLGTFPMRVQSIERTLIDKVFAVCDYYLANKPHRNARHLYDIYKLSEYVEINDDFKKLVKEVRTHRLAIGVQIALSAPYDVNIIELAHKIASEDFYEEDYKKTTLRLITDGTKYETVKDFYVNIVDQMFT